MAGGAGGAGPWDRIKKDQSHRIGDIPVHRSELESGRAEPLPLREDVRTPSRGERPRLERTPSVDSRCRGAIR